MIENTIRSFLFPYSKITKRSEIFDERRRTRRIFQKRKETIEKRSSTAGKQTDVITENDELPLIAVWSCKEVHSNHFVL